MLELSGVFRSHGRDTVLAGLSFTVEPGTSLSILGLAAPVRPAFFRLLDGTDAPDAGTVRVGGAPAAEARKRKLTVARVDQRGSPASGKSVRKTLEKAGAGGDLAERAGLKGQLDVAVKQLALEQRLRLAAACAAAAELALLDAPAADLAGEARARFLADLPLIVGRGRGIVVLATSAADEARALSGSGMGGRTLVLARGRLVQIGPAEEVFGRPRNLVVATATSAPVFNTLQVMMERSAGRLAEGASYNPPPGVKLPAEGVCTLGFRPDDLGFGRRDESCVRFAVRCAGEETIDGRRYARVTFGGASWLAPAGEARLAPGLMLNAFVERARLMVFDAEGQALE